MTQPDSFYRPWVDRTAGHIPDPLWRLRYLQSLAPAPPERRSRIWQVVAISAACALFLGAAPPHRRPVPPQLTLRPMMSAPAPLPVSNVWNVESTAAYDLYSNGLRIDNRYAIANHPRSYRAFPLTEGQAVFSELRTDPVGIVYHTTESVQAPFDASTNDLLKRVSESLAEYVQRRRAYNFLIDRFGRVYRIVREQDAANHAGHSVWADDSAVYINLNDSFLGVSFEAETSTLPGAEKVNPAQVRAAAMLTEMLRGRYHIPARNCATHAQVSVNPTNFRLGYHTDWASSFPFDRVGLPDNYALPLPAITLFGFTYDDSFVARAGDRLATAAKQSPAPEPKPARRRYHDLSRSLHPSVASEG
jgi:hypothetical protein